MIERFIGLIRVNCVPLKIEVVWVSEIFMRLISQCWPSRHDN